MGETFARVSVGETHLGPSIALEEPSRTPFLVLNEVSALLLLGLCATTSQYCLFSYALLGLARRSVIPLFFSGTGDVCSQGVGWGGWGGLYWSDRSYRKGMRGDNVSARAET